MELKQIKELMAALERTGTSKLKIEKDGFKLELERNEPQNKHFHSHSIDYQEDEISKLETSFQRRPASITLSGKETQSLAHHEIKPPEDTTSLYVTSPMVGTFYSSPSPEEPAFLKVGDHVDKNTVVCIVEAMKVMNEVKSGVSGVVAEVLIENGHPVEFGSKLFRITPQ